MSGERVKMTAKGRTYEVTGRHVRTALFCFTALTMLDRMVAIALILGGAGGGLALIRYFL